MATQLPIRVFARECPLDAAFGSVAPSLPGRNFGGEGGLIGGAARQALALEDADLDLGHVQPAGVHRGVVKFDSAQDAGGGFLAQHFLEAAAQMSVEVVEHQMHLSHFGVPAAQHPADETDKIFLGAPLRHLHMALLAARLDGDEDVAGARALVLVVLTQRHAGLGGQGATRLAQQLLALLVHADHWLGRIVGSGIEREQLVHASAILFGQLANAPH